MTKTKEIGQKQRRRVAPYCAIHEEDGKVVLVVEMPGVGKENVSISVENDELKILGTRKNPERGSTYLLRERVDADYSSSYTLDDTIDRDRIEAVTSQGVLTVTLHLKEASKPKQITVKEIN
jgi:HSP20 family protein